MGKDESLRSQFAKLKISQNRFLLVRGFRSLQSKPKQKRKEFKNKGENWKVRGKMNKKKFLILTFGAMMNKNRVNSSQRHCWCLFVLLSRINKTIIRRRWLTPSIFTLDIIYMQTSIEVTRGPPTSVKIFKDLWVLLRSAKMDVG